MRSLWVRYTYEEWTSEKEQAEAANSDWLATSSVSLGDAAVYLLTRFFIDDRARNSKPA